MTKKKYNRIGKQFLKNGAQTVLFAPQKIALFMIRVYQKTLSLDHGFIGKLFPHTRACRFYPSCSQYTYEAIDRFGLCKGAWLGVRRISRCTPWGPSGDDPVPEKSKSPK